MTMTAPEELARRLRGVATWIERLADGGTVYASKDIATIREAADLIDRLSATQQPEGWKLVPIEPTHAMIWNGATAFDHPSVYMGGPSEQGKRTAVRIFKAMLTAALSPKETTP